ncbi:MAG: hypothetical protein JRF63_00355 [Deltaproteobacteria bacterium]|nr:hypothetical protein [Deltaproteobacteria bacterium]
MTRASNILIALGAALGLLACEGRGIEQQFDFEDPVTDLHVLLEAGDIELIGTDEPVVRVEVDVSYHGSAAPVLQAFVDDSLLRVWLSCEDGCWDLGGRVTVYAPRDIRGKLDTGRGDVFVDGSAGELSIECGVGAIHGENLRNAELVAVTDQGPVTLSYTSRPTAVEVDVDRGNITVEVPAGGYDIDAYASSGFVELDAVVADPTCREELILATHEGNILVSGF